jgi:hypothetical protein
MPAGKQSGNQRKIIQRRPVKFGGVISIIICLEKLAESASVDRFIAMHRADIQAGSPQCHGQNQDG